MDFELGNGDSLRLLAPFADMLNHASEVEQCHMYDPKSGNLSVLAGKNYDPGDQVRRSSFPMLLIVHSFRRVLPGLHQLWTCSKQSPFTSLWLCRAQ